MYLLPSVSLLIGFLGFYVTIITEYYFVAHLLSTFSILMLIYRYEQYTNMFQYRGATIHGLFNIGYFLPMLIYTIGNDL